VNYKKKGEQAQAWTEEQKNKLAALQHKASITHECCARVIETLLYPLAASRAPSRSKCDCHEPLFFVLLSTHFSYNHRGFTLRMNDSYE